MTWLYDDGTIHSFYLTVNSTVHKSPLLSMIPMILEILKIIAEEIFVAIFLLFFCRVIPRLLRYLSYRYLGRRHQRG